MAIPELPVAGSRFHEKGAWWVGPAAGVQHLHRPMILQTGTVNVATDHPVKAVAPRPGGSIPVEGGDHLPPPSPLPHRQGGAGQPQAAAPAFQDDQELVAPMVQPLPVARIVPQAIPMDDRQLLPFPGLVNVAVADPEPWRTPFDDLHHI